MAISTYQYSSSSSYWIEKDVLLDQGFDFAGDNGLYVFSKTVSNDGTTGLRLENLRTKKVELYSITRDSEFYVLRIGSHAVRCDLTKSTYDKSEKILWES